MKRKNQLVALALIGMVAMAFVGCQKPQEKEPREVRITVVAPTTLESAELQSLDAKIAKGTDNSECKISGSVITARLVPGQYTLSVKAGYKVKSIAKPVEVKHQEQIDVPEGKGILELKVNLPRTLVDDKKGVLFQEIFFTGTKDQAGQQYDDDKYIKLVNSSLTTPYKLDGLVFARTGFMTNERLECTPKPEFEKYLYIDLALQFPAGEKGYTLQPGESIVICQSAVNHTEKNRNSIDFRGKAKYEWVDAASASGHDFPNAPEVTDLEPVVYVDFGAFSNDFGWSMNTNGGHGYALFRPAWGDAKSYLADPQNLFKYKHKEVYGEIDGDPYLRIPNEWVIDYVSTGVRNSIEWEITGALVNVGCACVADEGNSDARYGLSVQRKQDSNGMWVNTKNSKNDFEAKRATLMP